MKILWWVTTGGANAMLGNARLNYILYTRAPCDQTIPWSGQRGLSIISMALVVRSGKVFRTQSWGVPISRVGASNRVQRYARLIYTRVMTTLYLSGRMCP
jgi:hypothetical protein